MVLLGGVEGRGVIPTKLRRHPRTEPPMWIAAAALFRAARTPPAGHADPTAAPPRAGAVAVAESGFEIGRNLAFFKLFNRIQRRAIAMTAPIEMRLDAAADDPRTLGADGAVALVDDAPLNILSIGILGDDSAARGARRRSCAKS